MKYSAAEYLAQVEEFYDMMIIAMLDPHTQPGKACDCALAARAALDMYEHQHYSEQEEKWEAEEAAEGKQHVPEQT